MYAISIAVGDIERSFHDTDGEGWYNRLLRTTECLNDTK
jgi:hypothetical protein